MQAEEDIDVSTSLPSPEFLSAEELVSLRKADEETTQPPIGEKFYTCIDSCPEEVTLKSALEGYEKTLNKKRVGRICDLMQAVWDPEFNVVTTSKLKGKFTQHMGHLVNGTHILAPEEAVFLLENNCIEILNGETPMSTDEAFSTILKGNLAHEKYQTYSHLSKLGYIVVLHQPEIDITEYEKKMMKCPLKKRRPINEPTEGEPEKKRLTFTGALSHESELEATLDVSKDNSINSENETNLVSSTVSTEETDVKNLHSVSEEQNDNGAVIDKVAEDIQSDLDKINHTPVSCNELESDLESKGNKISTNPAFDAKSVAENKNVAQTEVSTKSNGINSQNLDELAENNKFQNNLQLKNVENQDFLDSNSQSSKIVDVMDVDTDADTCITSEASRDNFIAFDSNMNTASQDSCISVNNDDSTKTDVNGDSNCDVLSMDYSSVDEDEELLTVNAGTTENPLREDDEVTLLEVTKKETKPLAVIDLLSDDDDTEAVDVVADDDDDDITVIEEYPSSSTGKSSSFSKINSKKMMGFKKEEEKPIVSSSKLVPPLTVDVPDLLKNRVVCVARPSLNFLPHKVRPIKEAYVLNTNSTGSDRRPLRNRVWNSYRDMQDYQRQRRQNRHQNNPRAQPFSEFWNDRNSSNRDRLQRPGFGHEYGNYSDVNSNSRNHLSPTVDFNSNLYSANSYQNNVPLSNPTTMNCEVAVKEDTNESMVSSSSQPSQSNNFNPSSGMPNLPFMNPLIPNNNFFAGVQRNALSSMGNVSNNLMAELQRTCFTVATNMLSSMLNRNSHLLPNPTMPVFPPGFNAPGPFNPNISNGFNSSFSVPGNNEYFSAPPQNFADQQRRFHRGRPFPCRYRNIPNKRSWSDVRSAVCASGSDSDIEEMPISPREILWDNKNISPLVKAGIRYPVGSVFKFLQISQQAKVTNKYCYSEKLLPNISNLKVSFDVYSPGFVFKKSSPQVPKYRIVVVKSTDPFPKFADIAILQRKWNDGSNLLIAVNDNGDISFQSFNNYCLPSLTPHED